MDLRLKLYCQALGSHTTRKLRREDYTLLRMKTKLDKQTINEYYHKFLKIFPAGRLDKKNLFDLMNAIFPAISSQFITDSIFR